MFNMPLFAIMVLLLKQKGEMMYRIWGILRKNNRIIADTVAESNERVD